MDAPTISVVIPLYNKAPHIEKALQSVLQQTRWHDEIIVVDDGSTDGGAEIVRRYSQVQLMTQCNQGPGAARNLGVEKARGEYVAFLDADDWWLPNHLQTLLDLIGRFPQAALLSTAHVIERGGRTYRPRSAFPDGWSGIVDDFFGAFCVGLSLVNSITACVHREKFLSVGAFPTHARRGEDLIAWITLALAYPMAHAEIITATYYQDGVNRSEYRASVGVPEVLRYIRHLKMTQAIPTDQIRSAMRFFDRVGFFTAAGFALNGDTEGIKAIRRLSLQAGRLGLFMSSAALSIVPRGVLRAARNFRHPEVK